MTQVSLPFFGVKAEAKNSIEKRLRTVAGRIRKATKKAKCFVQPLQIGMKLRQHTLSLWMLEKSNARSTLAHHPSPH